VAIRSEPAQSTHYTTTLTYPGTVTAVQDATVTAVAGGRVESVLVVLGERVVRGQALVQLRTTDAHLGVQAAKAALVQASATAVSAELQSAQAALGAARDARERAEVLLNAGSTSQQELIRLRQNEVAAQAQVESTRAAMVLAAGRRRQAHVALEQSSLQASELTLRAPFDGVVVALDAKTGNTLASGAAAVRVVDATSLRVSFDVPPTEALTLQLGARVRVMGEEITTNGTVARRAAALQPAAKTVTFEADLESGAVLLPGALVGIQVDVGAAKTAIRIPRGAVRALAGVKRAFVVKDSRAEERLLRVAVSEPDAMLITDGVAAGEQVIIEPPASLRDGMWVTR
jgi:RND family efflux transporter MFP subunit